MKVKGIVLRSKNLGDRLRHLSLYTDRLGRINLIFKLDNSQFPLKYEPFSVSEFELLQKEDRWELKGAKLLEENFPQTFDELIYRSKISKLIYPYELQPSKKLFNLIRTYLRLNNSFKLSYVAFLSKFLYIEGIFPRLFSCVRCGSKGISGFSFEEGGVVCENCKREGEIDWNRLSSLQLREITKGAISEIKKKKFNQLNRIRYALEKHAQYRLNK
ncbi:MAG: DNA repair protein RecO [Thermovibrio sp.]|nr:MAG: DNA repair protein RecO [Thermovibrio sp.]